MEELEVKSGFNREAFSVDSTLVYYQQNAESFYKNTVSADLHAASDRFIKLLPGGAVVLDFGCGSGRDSKYFLERGFRVEAIDGSEELCRYASEYTGISVKHMLFQELDVCERYDAIWACASILHVSKADLPEIFSKMTRALKTDGIIYASFKYGDFEGRRNGRWFSDFTEITFHEFMNRISELQVLEQWISVDVRPGRGEEKWLNIVLKKSAIA